MARKRPLALLLAALALAPVARAAGDAARGGQAPADESDAPPGGDEPPPAEAPPPAETPPDTPPKEKPADPDHDSWFDAGHSFIEQRIVGPVVRLDRFFSDERELEAERARSFVRWRSEVRFTDASSQPSFTTGVRATLRLPGLNRRLRRIRVVMAGETRDAVSSLFPREPAAEEAATAEPTTGDEDLSRGDAGLRFFLWDSVFSHASLGGGVLVRLPPGAYGRIRFRWAVPVSKRFLLRSAVTGFWRTDVHFGTSAALELERPLTPRTAVRLGGSGTLSEESPGVEWRAELALLTAFRARIGAQLGVSVDGVTEPAPLEGTSLVPPDVARYRIYTRLRRDFYRSWIFLEVEPEIAWVWDAARVRQAALAPGEGGIGGIASPIEDVRGRHPVWGIAFRLELQFHGKQAPKPPPPPEPEDPPPEPEDPPPEALRALPRVAAPG